MKNNKIYIIGSGAIGKALAVFLQHEKKDVVLVRGSVDNLPDEETLITVTNQDHQKFQQKITTTTFSNLTDINGLVLIATKTFANAKLAQILNDKKGSFSIILLQNGLNIERPFASFEEVYRCVLLSTSQVQSENEIAFKTVAASPIGKIQQHNSIQNELIDHIDTPYFSFESVPDISKHVWIKVVINCAFNSICPLLEIDNGIFYRNSGALKLASIIIGECVALAGKYEVELDQKEIEDKLVLISRRSDGQLISTYEDIRNKRRTEIESLNLEISRLANEIGMPELVTNTRLLGEMIGLKSQIKID